MFGPRKEARALANVFEADASLASARSSRLQKVTNFQAVDDHPRNFAQREEFQPLGDRLHTFVQTRGTAESLRNEGLSDGKSVSKAMNYPGGERAGEVCIANCSF